MTIDWDAEDRCYVLTCRVLLPHRREKVFSFFSDAFQLDQITPAWLHFRVMTPAPVDLRKGCLIDYRIRLLLGRQLSARSPPAQFHSLSQL